jgi:DNA-directed RNA polymerase subunit beta'
MATTVGHFLINDVMPKGYEIRGPITNKELHDHLVNLAKTDPQKYVSTIQALKRRGDEIATLEGISVGLDDIEPNYKERDAIIRPALAKLEKLKDPTARQRLIVETQEKLLAHTKKHPGSMTHMALSGARGNPAQLMKIVATPLATVHPKHGVIHQLIDRSYAEGLTPAQYWMTGPEIRENEVKARISVSEPGEMAKVLVANTISTVVTTTDCGTMNGVKMSIDDSHILDRFTQADHGLPRNTLVTPQIVQQLKAKHVDRLLVRSPMTCIAQSGVCQMCQGHNEKGKLHQIGTPVGVRAAQAMAEPLTQMALSSRHGTLTIKSTNKFPTGLKGVRQLLEVPASFRHEAVLAPEHGTITKIEKAPQGGHYIYIGEKKVYTHPDLTLRVKKGDVVERGDALTDGVPHPAKIVGYKGLGAGRAYFVDAMHNLYKNEGINLDRRHLELLAKSEINHVRLLDTDPNHPELLKGDIINYNAFREAYREGSTRVPLDNAVGQRLGQEVLHHTVGTLITPALARELASHGVTEVYINRSMPPVEFVMKPFTMNPLLEKDWMARLAHRYLKNTILEAAHFGETSNIHSTHPVPAYAYGAEFRHGSSGTF